MPRVKKADLQPLPEKDEATEIKETAKPLKAVKEEPAETETRYSAASLRRNAMQLFQVNPEVVDGALYGTESKEHTIAEVKSLITAYLTREVR